MASGSNSIDVSAQFQKMAEKFGWLKHGDLDQALQSLSKSTKKKKSTKSRTTEKKKTDRATDRGGEANSTLRERKDKLQSHKTPTTLSSSITPRKAELTGFLSSDSDSSFTTVPEVTTKPAIGLRGLCEDVADTMPEPAVHIRVICSDSDEEEKPKEDTYISCIGESALWMTDTDPDKPRLSGSPSTNYAGSKPNMCTKVQTDRKSCESDDYEDSILRNRLSMMSLISDVDSIGEPLVESTRIHRRSSVTYQQLMSSLDEEDCDTQQPPSSKRVHTKNVYYPNSRKNINKKNYYHNDSDPDIIAESPEVSPVKDVKYVTALEILVDEKGETNKEDTANKTDRGGLDTSRTSSNEYVEVMDVATQTQISNTPVKLCTPKHSNPVCKIYSDETLNSSDNKPVYNELTVAESAMCEDGGQLDCQAEENHTEFSNSVCQMSAITSNNDVTSPYDQTTISNISTKSIPKKIDFEETHIETGDDMNIYSQITVDTSTLGDNSNNKDSITSSIDIKKSNGEDSNSSINVDSAVFSEISSNKESDDVCDKQEDSNISNSDTSVYEVVDVGTQTEHAEPIPYLNHSNPSDSNGSSQSENDIDRRYSKPNSCEPIKPKPGNKRQKANLCFEISSDSDIEDGLGTSSQDKDKSNRSCNDTRDSSVGNGVENTNKDKGNSKSDSEDISDQSVSDNIDVTEAGNGKETIPDTYEECSVPARPDRNIDKASEKPCEHGNNWRNRRKADSESSSDDNLEAFLQKLKNPEKEKSSDSSSKSMKDFIVEDDEMTSESDDEAFYITETQKLHRSPLLERFKANKNYVDSQSDDSSDEAFSSKLYPSSVTKHKKKRQQGKTHGSSVCSSLYWDSSDSDTDGNRIRSHDNKTNTQTNNTENIRGKKGKHTRKQTRTIENFDSDSDLDNKEIPKQHDKNKIVNSKVRGKELKQKDVSSTNSDPDSSLFKTPNFIRKFKSNTLDIPDRSSSSASFTKTPLSDTNSVASFGDYISLSDDDNSSDDDSLPSLHTSNKENIPDCQTPRSTKVSCDSDIFKTPLSTYKTPKSSRGSESRGHSFLKSLSTDIEDSKRHPNSIRYIRNFKKTREELVRELFNIYNNNIFDKKLPTDLPIIWNKRLLKTAGYCVYKCKRQNKEDRTARIELSSKVCDSAERVRDTLIHELCHAAVWLLNGVNGGHGNFWKYWARRSSHVHPELPTISRCHSYAIKTKFTYRCTRCGSSIGRHSKSLDTSRKVCGLCKGTFELIQNATPMTPQSASSTANSAASTPRIPNKFAMFVKDNYNNVKQKNKDLKHGDVMKELSRLFAENKINS